MASVIGGHGKKSTDFSRPIAQRIFADLAVCCLAMGWGQLMAPCMTASEPRKPAQTIDRADQPYYANAHAYLYDTEERLISQVPELKGLNPAADQNALPNILDKTGATTRKLTFYHCFGTMLPARIDSRATEL